MEMMTQTQPLNPVEVRPADNKSEQEKIARERESKVDQIIQTRQEAFLVEEKTLLKWDAPSRVFKKKSREYFTTIGAIVILVCLILLFVQEFLLIGVIGAIAFVAYASATVAPEKVTHEISTRGIRTGGKFYRWDELGRYWFEDRGGQMVLNVETYMVFPRQLIMLVSEKEKIKELLAPYLLFETPEPGFLDKTSDWLAEKVPLDTSE